jgi:hypothetical protein
MHKVILFRGGMFGDIVLSMLNKEYVRSVYPRKLVRERRLMKKFYNFSTEEKYSYLNRMDGYTISHDTEFCKQIDPEQVIQIYCSDEKMIPHIADRFWQKNPSQEVDHVKQDLNLNEHYSLAEDIKAWQDFHVFKNRFDIKNIYSTRFINDLQKSFVVDDIAWAKTIHNIWLN